MLYDVLLLLHVLAWVYWLGADLGVLHAARYGADERLSIETRRTIGEITAFVDLFPRLCLPLIGATGATLAMLSGRLAVGGAGMAGLWIVTSLWIGLTLFAYRHRGDTDRRAAALRIDTAWRVVLIPLVTAVAGASWLGGTPDRALAAKLLIYAVAVALTLVLREVFRPYRPALARLEAGGGDTAADSAIMREALGRARPVVLAIWGLTVLAAAIGLWTSSPVTTPPATTEAALRVGIVSLPPAYGNPYAAMGAPGAVTWQQLFDGLTRVDEEGRIAPALAREWRALDDHTWHFRLRDDVRYADGTPFDADRARAVFDWLLGETGRLTPVGNELRGLAEVSAPGPHELVIRTHEPDPILPNRLTVVMMVEPDAWVTLGPAAFGQQPVGTGPFVVRSWRNRSGAAELVANPHGWRRPHVTHVEVFPLQDHAARFQAAISRQLHLVQSIRPEAIESFEARGFRVQTDPVKQIIGLAFDVEGHPGSPVADRRVRQALNLAVDTDAISDRITYGVHAPAGQGAVAGVVGHNPDVRPYPHDPVRARALLAEAGYPDGFAIRATIVMGTYANDVEIYQQVQQDLGAIGVEIVLEATLFPDWLRQYVTGQWRTEAFSLAWNTAPYHDAIRPMEYFSCRKAAPFYCNPAMTPALDRAATEMQPAARERALQALQQRFHDEAPSLFLLEYGHLWAASDEVHGFALANGAPELHRVRLEPRE